MNVDGELSLKPAGKALCFRPSCFRSRYWLVIFVALLGAELAPFAAAQKGQREAPTRSELIRRRQEWFYRQRAFPLEQVPTGARLRALEQLRTMHKAREAGQWRGTVAGAASSTPWVALGPQPATSPFFQPFTSGRVTALAINPANPNNVYLGAAQGGIWKTADGGTTWTPLTDNQPSLAVGSMAVDPTTCTTTGCLTIFVGTGEENFAFDSYYGAGILKSTDGGATWTVIGASAFGSVSPIDSSSNGPRIGAIAVNPTNSQILLAAVQGFGSSLDSGLWRSTDSGKTWVHVLPTTPFNNIFGTDVAFDPADATGKTAYAALGNPGGQGAKDGVYKSTDGGVSWTQLNLPGFSPLNFGRIALAVGPAVGTFRSGVVFAAVADASTFSTDLLGVFKSTDGGTSWTKLSDPLLSASQGFCNTQCFYDIVIRVSPSNPNLVFAGGAATPRFGGNASLIRSLDGGNGWAEVSNNESSVDGVHVDIHALAFSSDGSKLYVGSDGGVWSTDNPALHNLASPIPTWTNLNQTLGTTQFYPGLSIHPSNPAFRTFGGTQDNGLQRYSGGGGTPFNPLQWDDTGTLGDAGFTAIDPNVPSTVYASSEFFPSQFLFLIKSQQNGNGIQDFVLLLNGIMSIISDNGNFIPPFAMDPSNSQRLYFGSSRVWQTNDGGNSWIPISPDLAVFCTGPSNCISAVAVAPSDSNTIWAGTGSGQVWVTTTGGTAPSFCGFAWCTAVPGNRLPLRAVTQVAAAPNNSLTAYATLSGFSIIPTDTKGHVFKTTDSGQNWTDISGVGMGALPNIPVNDIVIDPEATPLGSTLYVGTDIGVFASSDGGTTWAPLGAGLPNVAVVSLKLHRASRTLHAATHGRSVWALQLPDSRTFAIRTISPASANVGDPGVTVNVNGMGFSPSSQVRFDGNAAGATTTFVNSTELSASLAGSLLASGKVAQITVFDSPQTPSSTNALFLTVLNPAPTVNSIAPSNYVAPAPANFQLMVNGSNFTSNSTLQLSQLTSSSFAPASVSSASLTVSGSGLVGLLGFGGRYAVSVSNPLPGGGSSNPELDPSLCCGLIGTGPVPPNDPISNATVIPPNASGATTFTATEDSSGATSDTADPAPSCAIGAVNGGRAKSVWFKFTANGTGKMNLDTIGSSYDTILSVYQGPSSSLMIVACNDDIVPGVNRVSKLSFTANTGVDYFFMITDFEGFGGKTVLNLSASLSPPPNFATTLTATSATVRAGQSTPPVTVTLTPQPGSSSGTVVLSCAGLPSKSSCNFSPRSSVALSGPPLNVTLTISTTAPATTFSLPRFPKPFTLPAYGKRLEAAAIVLFALLLLARRRAARNRLGWSLALLALLGVLIFQVSCRGGGGGALQPIPGTAPGTYTITLNSAPASSGGQTAPTFTLTVQ